MTPPDPTEKPVLQRVLTDRRSPLRQLIARSEHLAALQQQVYRLIPGELHSQVTVAGVTEHSLLLITHSGAWAARLRQLQGGILRDVQQQLPELQVRGIQIKVRPQSRPRKPIRQANRLSQDNAELLLQEAEHTEHDGLKRILQRLASHTRKPE